MRETLFNILGQRLGGEHVLDLYAGSGALALEALSRGAADAVLVERDREAARVCAENAAALGYEGRAQVMRADIASALRRLTGPFDLVFIDPPYAEGPAAALQLLGESGLLAAGALVIAEHDKREQPAERFGTLLRREHRRFGDSAVSIYERTPQEPA